MNSQCAAVKPCSETYSAAIDTLTPAPNVPYCKALSTYSKCVDRISPRQCRGDLSFHSTITIIQNLLNNYNCTFVLEQDALRTAIPPTAAAGRPTVAGHQPEGVTEYPSMVTPPKFVPGQCEYKGNKTFRHCGLFGDPHLRTFYDESMTCRAAGAWPMVYNEYLAVQVTNVPLVHGSGATATNKVCMIMSLFVCVFLFVCMFFAAGTRPVHSSVHVTSIDPPVILDQKSRNPEVRQQPCGSHVSSKHTA